MGGEYCQHVGAVHVDEDYTFVLWTESDQDKYCQTKLVKYEQGTEIDSVSISDMIGSEKLTDASPIYEDGQLSFTVSTKEVSYLITGKYPNFKVKETDYTNGMYVVDKQACTAHDNGKLACDEWTYQGTPSKIMGIPSMH